MKTFELLLFLLLIFHISAAQNDSLNIYKVEAAKAFDEERYSEAIEWYKKISEINPEDAEAFFRIGFSYWQSVETVARSIRFFDQAYVLYNKLGKIDDVHTALFYKANAYHRSYQFDEAIILYNKLLNLSKNNELLSRVRKELRAVTVANEFLHNPQHLLVTRYGILNSSFDDHSPVISADEEVLMFTSKRPTNVGGLKTESGTPYEDIYVFRKGENVRPENIGSPINTNYHDATCGLSVDGNSLFIYRATKRDGGDIFQSKFNGMEWSKPVRLGPNINTKYRETHASLSADGRFLYITSNRKGGYGGFDIYVSELQADQTWGPAKNLGAEINTVKNEIGPYIHPDGRTLYFSSDGHPGMGGYDVFISEQKPDGSWSDPENIGFPLNTLEHDVFFVPTIDGKGGYYSSQKEGSTNIYKATFIDKPETRITLIRGYVHDMQVRRERVEVSEVKELNGVYHKYDGTEYIKRYRYDKADGKFKKAYKDGNEIVFVDSSLTIPQNVRISLIDVETGSLVKEFAAANHDGKFLIIEQSPKDYKLVFEAEGHVFDAFDIKKEQQKGFFKLDRNAQLDDVSQEYLRATHEIGFEVGLTTLNKFAKIELDYLAEFMKKYPKLQVDITGCHYLVYESDPDYRRLECEYANARKNKITEYLVNKGISENRIKSNLFPTFHDGDTLSYTIFNAKQGSLEKKIKEQQIINYIKVQELANITEEEIRERYGSNEVLKRSYVTENIKFGLNKHVTSKYTKSLSELAKYLKTDEKAQIVIAGYTDSQGNKAYNYELSRKRALFVKNELVKLGAKPEQIEIKSSGIENPIAKNKTKTNNFYTEALQYNRRVEISVKKKSRYAELYIKQIEMPEKYLCSTKESTSKNTTYSIGLMITKEKRNLRDFKVSKVSERCYSDGKYLYFFGKYLILKEAVEKLNVIKKEYPEAFIFSL